MVKRELINQALKKFVDNSGRKDFLALEGKTGFAKEYDYKSLREGK